MNLKRAFDVAVSLAGIVVASPVILSVGFSMAVANKSSPVFTQRRIGLNSEPFTIYKIKSMNDNRDADGGLLPDEHRTSALGKFIRRSHLDELPQFYNVLMGDMSIVGPRPIPAGEHNDEKRHSVKPGITGLAQISGKNLLSLDQRLELDHYYVDNNCMSMDFMICARTPASIIKHRDAPHFREIKCVINEESVPLVANDQEAPKRDVA